MNILLTSIGRRGYLARYFREALGSDGQVIATNTDGGSPGMQEASQSIVVPSSNDPTYIDALLRICERYSIQLLCSCHDLDVLILSRHPKRFEEVGATPVLPSAEWAELCLDKYKCAEKLAAQGYSLPWQTVSLEEAKAAASRGKIQFPLIVKARHGFGSLGLNISENIEELVVHYRQVQRQVSRSPLVGFLDIKMDESVLIQEYLKGEEYCLDIVHNLDGAYESSFACRVHAMRAGESDSATTVDIDRFGNLDRRLSETVQYKGIIGVDVMMCAGVPKIIELNPRFTGDYPYQQLAGANIPAALVAWRKGATPHLNWLHPKIGVSGYKDLVPRVSKTGNDSR